jgi:hypothetical protein
MNKIQAQDQLILDVKAVIDVDVIYADCSFNPQQNKYVATVDFSIKRPVPWEELERIMKNFKYSPAKLSVPNRMRVTKGYTD